MRLTSTVVLRILPEDLKPNLMQGRNTHFKGLEKLSIPIIIIDKEITKESFRASIAYPLVKKIKKQNKSILIYENKTR